MKKKICIFFMGINLLYIHSYSIAKDNKYPITYEERKMQEIGSIFDNKNYQINKEKKVSVQKLWEASLYVLKDIPLISSDFNGGVIITDWYNISPIISNKVTIIIYKDTSNVEVKVFQRKLINNKFQDIGLSNDIANKIHQQIIDKVK